MFTTHRRRSTSICTLACAALLVAACSSALAMPAGARLLHVARESRPGRGPGGLLLVLRRTPVAARAGPRAVRRHAVARDRRVDRRRTADRRA